MSRSNPQKVIDWRKRTKERIIECMGGKCCECGYNTCKDALELHHLDPSTKSFSMGGIRARPRSWKTIVEELKKCIMVCANCHREIESGLRIPTTASSTFNIAFEDYTPIGNKSHPESNFKHSIVCKTCGIVFKGYRITAKYCSDKCRC